MDEIERLPTVAKRLEAMQDERSESQGIISASDAMRLSEPESVLRRDTDSDAVAIVCSVGEPTILTGPGGTGKSWLALMLACAAAEGAVRAEDPIVEANTEAEAAAEATAIAEDTADERAEELAEAWAEEDYQYATEVEAAAADAAKVEVDVVAAASLKRLPELAEEIAAIAECEATAMVEAEVAAAAKYAAEARAEAESATRADVPWETACGLAVRPGPVVLVSYEDRPARITARLRAMETTDAVLERLHIVIEPEPLWRPADKTTGGACVTAAFRSLVERLNALRPSLVVLDPISAAAGSLNLNDGGTARYAMRSLAKLSAELGVGILIVAHDTKSARGAVHEGRLPGAGAVGGSAQWFDAARGVLYMRLGPESDPNIDRELVALKVNNGAAGWVIPLAEDYSDDGAFRGLRLTRDNRIADTTTIDESCSDEFLSLSEEDIPF